MAVCPHHLLSVRFFPHEVKDLEVTWNFLKQGATQDSTKRKRKWEVDYILLLWLSVILYIPFSLTNVVRTATIDELLDIGKAILASPAKTRDASAEMLSRLLTRPDMESGPLDSFLHWANDSLDSSDAFLVRRFHVLLVTIVWNQRRRVVLHPLTTPRTTTFCAIPNVACPTENGYTEHVVKHLQEGKARGTEGQSIHHICQVRLHDDGESCAEVAVHEADTAPWACASETQDTKMEIQKR